MSSAMSVKSLGVKSSYASSCSFPLTCHCSCSVKCLSTKLRTWKLPTLQLTQKTISNVVPVSHSLKHINLSSMFNELWSTKRMHMASCSLFEASAASSAIMENILAVWMWLLRIEWYHRKSQWAHSVWFFLVYREVLPQEAKCSAITLSPHCSLKCKRATKLPGLACGCSSICFQSSQWPLSAMPWRPQNITASAIDLSFSLFLAMVNPLAFHSCWSTGIALPSIMDQKFSATCPAAKWYFLAFPVLMP